jgi:4-hydroxy-3-methylbut-2-en-1-yl diphosphate reductase
MRQFDVPDFYQSPIISTVKQARRAADPKKKDLAPTVLDFGPVRFKVPRHFGFCYGVENAIEIAYRALQDHPEKAAAGRVFLLSEMIHNPHVNEDLLARGIRFLRTTTGEQLIEFDELRPDDVVIVPAFGTTLEITDELARRGVETETYNTTCPFVEKVWKRSAQIGKKDYTIVVHGKRFHEETRATFSHARANAPVVVVRDLAEAEKLARVISREEGADFFFREFADRYSEGFEPDRDLVRIGVVNQTTMLASETQAIADLLRDAVRARDAADEVATHFADTSDTLCYATKENQDATYALIEDGADLAIVVGGFNSSNTSHLVELCGEVMPTFFVDGPAGVERDRIEHFDLHTHSMRVDSDWLPRLARPVDIVVTAGASCPDALLDGVVRKIIGWFDDARAPEDVVAAFLEAA